LGDQHSFDKARNRDAQCRDEVAAREEDEMREKSRVFFINIKWGILDILYPVGVQYAMALLPFCISVLPFLSL